MIEDAQEIFDFLPISFRNAAEQEYINFLWDAFVINYSEKPANSDNDKNSEYKVPKYHFAFLAYHMLFMSFVYFEIWQIKANNIVDFEKAMVGFNKDMENELLKASTPFLLWRVNESSVFRFLKLIGMTNADIGQCTKIVSERNDAAHSNGNIFFRNPKDLDQKIEEILQCVEKIQTYSGRVVESCYEKFLIESSDIETRENLDDENQIREVLVYGNYLSPRDIFIIKSYNVQKLNQESNFESIESLAKKLHEMYPDE